MAQPQGLNVPAIITTGIVSTLLIAAVIEGVYAYYNVSTDAEIARKWEAARETSVDRLRTEQKQAMDKTIDAAMKKITETGGKLPATQPTKG